MNSLENFLLILSGWVVAFYALRGYGVFLTQAIFRRVEPVGRAWEFWIGAVGLTLILEVTHCFLPINLWSSIPLLGLGSMLYGRSVLRRPTRQNRTNHKEMGHPVNHLNLSNFGLPDLTALDRPRLFSLARLPFDLSRLSFFSREEWLTALLTGPVVLWGLGKMFQLPQNYDSGLYHFPTIQWINEMAIVPGLANLHGRLGFNQSSFLLVALFNFFPLAKIGYMVIGPLFYLVFYAQLAHEFVLSLLGKNQGLRGAIGWGLLLYFYIDRKNEAGLSTSPAPDSILMSFGGVLLLAVLKIRELSDQRTWFWGVLPLLFAAAITFKLSAVVWVAVLALYCLFFFGQRLLPHAPTSFSLLLPAVLLLIIWVIRGYITSGYPFFPLAIGRLPVDWAVPPEKVAMECNSITYWAQSVFGSIPFTPYTLKWFQAYGPFFLKWHFLMSVSLGLSSAFLSIYALLCLRKMDTLSPEDYLLLAPLFLQLFAWFFQAPDPRFLGGNPFLLTGLAFGLLFLKLQKITGPSLFNAKNFGLAFSTAFALYVTGWAFAGAWTTTRKLCTNQYPHLFEPPVVSYHEFHLDSQHTLYMPQGTDQAWDGPFPTIPYPNNKFRLRTASWQSGFQPQ